ncbi:hypothetical protein B0J17DRAFT_723115 [Rhizoctonia solani]|nr:hypothetical protein B0J17DRAFT_723115 [Rhizoctonia solani]
MSMRDATPPAPTHNQHVHDRDFNIEDRSSVVQLPNGRSQSAGYGLLQSDITTIISALLAFLRLILASIAWNKGSQYDPGWSKRVLQSYNILGKESQLENTTLPHFEIHSLEWIADPVKTLTKEQLDFHWRKADERNPCTKLDTARWISGEFSPGAGFYSAKGKGECWAFAWVNFTAGAANCLNCRVSSFATVQNEGKLTVQEDHMSAPVLRLMPTVISTMALMNSSLPSPWRNVDNYVREALGRSYAVAWDALVEWLGESDVRLQTAFSPSVPSSRAQVDPIRIYLWLIIQLLVTFSGTIFLLLRDRLRSPPVKDVTLELLYLDTTAIYQADGHEKIESNGLIQIEHEDGRRKLRIE